MRRDCRQAVGVHLPIFIESAARFEPAAVFDGAVSDCRRMRQCRRMCFLVDQDQQSLIEPEDDGDGHADGEHEVWAH